MPAAMNIQPAKRGDAVGLAAHAYRYGTQEGHVDRSRTKLNRTLRGPETFSEMRAIIEGLPDRQPPKEKGKAGRKIRTDANYTAQLICTFPEELDADQLDAWVAATVAWAEEDAPGQLLYAVLHRDEKSPHLHMAIHAVEPSGKLNYKALFGRPSPDQDNDVPPVSELTALQASYADRLAAAELAIDPTQGLAYEHTGIAGWRKLKAASTAAAKAEARADAAETRAAAAEERAAQMETDLERAAAALSSPLEVPLLTPALQRRQAPEQDREDEDDEGRWIPSQRPAIHQEEARVGSPGSALMRLPWLAALRDWMMRQATLRAQLIGKYPKLLGHLGPVHQALQQARDNVRRLNDRGNQSIIARDVTQNVPESESSAESVPTSADSAESVPDDNSADNNVHEDTDDESIHLEQDRDDYGREDEDDHDGNNPAGLTM